MSQIVESSTDGAEAAAAPGASPSRSRLWSRARTSRSAKAALAVLASATLLSAGAVAGAQAGSDNSGPPGTESRAGLASPTEHGFVPVTPCRIVNTQNGARMAVNEVREFRMASGTGPQGGALAGCGIPGAAVALEISVTAPAALGNGYLRIGAAGQPTPTATFLNYSNVVNLTNAGTVAVRQGTSVTNLRVQTFVRATHVIVDVLGYYVPHLQASVTANGAVVRGNGGPIATREAAGTYRVNFNRSVSGCAYTATIGNPSDGVPPSGEITATPNQLNSFGVYIQTRTTGGTLADRPFHLSITC